MSDIEKKAAEEENIETEAAEVTAVKEESSDTAATAKKADAKKADAKVKTKKKDKPSLFSRIKAWFKAFKAEFKKIVWTAPRTVLKNSIVVIICVAIVAAVIVVLDYVFSTSIVGLSRLI